MTAEEQSIQNWVSYCFSSLSREYTANPNLTFKETKTYQSVLLTLDERLVDPYLKEDDLRGLFTLYAQKLFKCNRLAEIISAKYNDYSFIDNFSILLGEVKTYEIGLRIAHEINRNIEAAENPNVRQIPKRDINKLISFFTGKKQDLPTNSNTYDMFKTAFLVEILNEVMR